MFFFVYTLSECMSSNHIHWIGIIMVLHIILYNLISILLLVLAILCFILISVFLVGTYCIEFPSFGCLCGYILSVFFFQFVSQWFRGVILYHCGHFAPHFVQFAYLFCHLILHFSGFVSHCWWFCALFIYCYGISFVHYGGSHMLNCLSFCQFCCFVCFASLLRYMIASL